MNARTESPRPTISSLHGIVASAHFQASQAGARTLAAGGNAFDAAVTVASCLNVAEPFMSGLAGMGFATMWVAAEKRVRVLDYVPPVHKSFPEGKYTERGQLLRGGQAVGLPANLAGWCKISETYGKLPLEKALEPAVKLAAEGFGVAEFGAQLISEASAELSKNSVFGAAFAENYPYAKGLKVGDIIRQPQLAESYRLIGKEGPAALYRGVLGEKLTRHVQSIGGTMTMEDLAAVEAVWRDPASITYRGLKIHIPPPPCEGFQFLLTLRLLESADVAKLEHNGVQHLDLVMRAIRLAAGVRIANSYATPEKLAEILSEPFVEKLRERLHSGKPIKGQTEQWMAEAPEGEDPGHTTSFSIADKDGNMICVTQSLGAAFGSGVVVPGTGICLNNFLYWADVQPGSPNRAAPGRALPMCMSPSISTKDGVPVLALGTPGSYGILQTQAQAMVQHLDFGLPLQDAISAPRVRLWDGTVAEVEPRVAPGVMDALRERGHDAKPFAVPYAMHAGGMQAIRRNPETGLMTGAADPRRDGWVVGV